MGDKQKLSCEFTMHMTNFEKLNENFTKAKCYVLALGKNQNRSYFGVDAVNAAYPSLAYVPVVGHLMKTEDGHYYLGGHDYKLNKQTLEMESLCVPFGVAVPSPEPVYESVVEADDTISTYLTTDVILWTGRYPELEDAMYDDTIMFGQSMEVFFSRYAPLAEDPTYTDIQEFTFDALCMLNKSDDPKFNIEPCFPNASIVATDYSAINAEFAALFSEMKEELKSYFTANNQGGSNVKDGNKTPEPVNKIAEFAATYGKKRDAITTVLDGLYVNAKDDEGNIVAETFYWLMDFDDTYAFVEKANYSYDGDYHSDYSHWRIPYTYAEDTQTAAFSGEAEAITCEWLTAEQKAQLEAQTKAQFEEQINQIEAEKAEVTEKFEALETEAKELRTFKADTLAEQRRVAEEALFAKFDDKLSNVEGYAELKEHSAEFALEVLEEKCNALFGKFALANVKEEPQEPKKAEFSKTSTDLSGSDMGDEDKIPYGGLMEAWRSKHN